MIPLQPSYSHTVLTLNYRVYDQLFSYSMLLMGVIIIACMHGLTMIIEVGLCTD